MNQSSVQTNLSFGQSFSKAFCWNNDNTTLTINPSSDLSYSTTYTITVGWNATDTTGNVMIANDPEVHDKRVVPTIAFPGTEIVGQ